MRTIRVALVNMPFATLYRPSIGLSLLKAALRRDGHHVDLHYLNLNFADRIGSRLYTQICDSSPVALLGEWLFAAALFAPTPERDQMYLDHVLPTYEKRGIDAAMRQDARTARAEVEPYLQACLAAVDWSAYDVIGFTSVFQQNVATMAFARRLKERYPEKLIAVGGANAEGAMGRAILQAFPWIDLVCSGEGDLAFPELIRRLGAGEPCSGIPGITLQGDLASPLHPGGWPVHEMDALPYPDYDDYFQQLHQHAYAAHTEQEARFMFESSRGCWWGAKSHCKFCGLNGGALSFRSKSAQRALTELRWLYERYKGYTRWAAAVDNIIDMQYFRDFLPALKELGLDLNMFYETKANLTREQVQLFAEAGMTMIQPGIESLSTPVLRLMRKGVTALQNIQVAKWCREFGVRPYWNYLYGFPGEDPAEYRRVAELLPALSHLDPPYGYGQLRLDRFSPYFDDPASDGIINVRPHTAYRYAYPGLPASLLDQLAYYFEFDYADGRDPATYVADLEAGIIRWRKTEGSELFSVILGERLVIFDLRPAAAQATHLLAGAQQALYTHCDAIRSRSALQRHLTELGYEREALDLESLVAPLRAAHLLVEEGEYLLALAIPLGVYSPGPAGARRFLEYLTRERERTGQATTADIRIQPGDLTGEPVEAARR